MNLEELFEYRDGDDGFGLYWLVDRGVNKVKGKRFGCVHTRCKRGDGSLQQYRLGGVGGKKYQEHRLIWQMFHGKPDPSLQIDHIDGDSLNNNIDNLRLVTQAVNLRNQRKNSNNTSGFTGVTFHKRCNRWTAQWWEGGKLKVKYFPSTDEGFQEACQYRQQQIDRIGGYTDRHGKR